MAILNTWIAQVYPITEKAKIMSMTHKLKKTGRECFLAPTMLTDGRQTWSHDHRRVFIPFTPQEAKSSKGMGHIQIVHHTSLEAIR